MKRTINTTKLTKAFIESRISQEDIVAKYLDIPINVVDDCVKHNHLIKSVFRDDDTDSSMGIAYNMKGRLKVRDFNGCFFGSCNQSSIFFLNTYYFFKKFTFAIWNKQYPVKWNVYRSF